MTKRTRVYQFGPFRFYPDQMLLFRLDERLDVDRKALAILGVLVRNHGQLVTKERLLSEVWGNVQVEEGNISVQLSKIRNALGENRKNPEFIDTVHGEGYRFIAIVTEREEELYPDKRRKALHWSFALASVGVLVAVAAFVWSRTHMRSPVNAPPLSTSSAEARSRYQLALKYESQGDDQQALTTLNEATAIDKEFIDAYLKASFVANQVGEEGEAQDYLDKAKNCARNRTEHQQLQIDALEAELNESYQAAMTKYRLLVDAYPDDAAGWYYFADYAMQSRKGFPDASDALDHCLRLDPVNPFCEFDRMTLLVLNDSFDKAIALYDSLKPLRYPWLDEPFGLALYGKGELDRARDVLGNFSKKSGMHGLTGFTTGREWLADIDLYQGKIAEATREIEVLPKSDTRYGVSTHYLYLARVNALLSNQNDAKNLALKAVSVADTRDTRIEAAAILTCAGSLRDVGRVLQMGTKEPINNLTPSTEYFIDGCKALNNRDYSGAIRELQASYDIQDDLDTELFLAKAYIGARQWKDARTILEDLQSSKGRIIADQSNPPVIWALAHYYLGLVCEESGDTEGGATNYAKFLEIWKDGDPKLTVISDAKQRLARSKTARSMAVKTPV